MAEPRAGRRAARGERVPSHSRRWLALAVAIVVIAGAVAVVATLAADDEDGRRPEGAQPAATRATPAPAPASVGDILADPGVLANARVELDDAQVTRIISKRLAVIDDRALLVTDDRPLRIQEGDTVDVGGYAIAVPGERLVEDLRESRAGRLLELVGADPDAIAAIKLLVVAERVVPG